MKTTSQKFCYLLVALLCALGCSGTDDPVAVEQEEVKMAKLKGAFILTDTAQRADGTPFPLGDFDPLFKKLVIFEFSISEVTGTTVGSKPTFSGPIADVRFSGDIEAAAYMNREVAPTFRGLTLVIRVLSDPDPLALVQVDIFPPSDSDRSEQFLLTFTTGFQLSAGGDIVLDHTFAVQGSAFIVRRLQVDSQLFDVDALEGDSVMMSLEGFRDVEL